MVVHRFLRTRDVSFFHVIRNVGSDSCSQPIGYFDGGRCRARESGIDDDIRGEGRCTADTEPGRHIGTRGSYIWGRTLFIRLESIFIHKWKQMGNYLMVLTGGTNDSPERNDVGVVVVHVKRHIGVSRILHHDNLVIMGRRGKGWVSLRGWHT